MRTISGPPCALIVVLAAGILAGPAVAQTVSSYPYPYGYSNQTYSYGLYLPQVPQPNGQDEIRAADGTTCRSSMASNDAYLDVGGIGGQSIDGSFDSGTVYGRVIVPLGTVPKRLDCSALYNLEIARLKHELELMRSGLGMRPGVASGMRPAEPGAGGWAEQGWSDRNAPATGGATSARPSAGGHAPSAADGNGVDGVVPMRLVGAEAAELRAASARARAGSAPPASDAAPPSWSVSVVASP